MGPPFPVPSRNGGPDVLGISGLHAPRPDGRPRRGPAGSLCGGCGRTHRAMSAGGPALTRCIQRRHLPAARSPVPASAMPRCWGRPPVVPRGPTRSSRPTGAKGPDTCCRRPSQLVRRARSRHMRAPARMPGRGRPALESVAAVLTFGWRRCMRYTIRSDAADRDTGRRSRSKPGDLSRATTFALVATTIKARWGDRSRPVGRIAEAISGCRSPGR